MTDQQGIESRGYEMLPQFLLARLKIHYAEFSRPRSQKHPTVYQRTQLQLLQLCVFGFGLLQDGDVGIGVFPKGEEVLVSSFGFCGVARHSVGTAELQVGECPQNVVRYDGAVIDDLLEFGRRLLLIPYLQICFTSHVYRVKTE